MASGDSPAGPSAPDPPPSNSATARRKEVQAAFRQRQKARKLVLPISSPSCALLRALAARGAASAATGAQAGNVRTAGDVQSP